MVIRPLTSRHNPRVKELRAALLRTGRGGDCIAIEGEHLLLEALRSHLHFAAVFVKQGSEDRLASLPLDAACEIFSLPEDIFLGAVTTESPQPLAALVRAPGFPLHAVLGDGTSAPLILVAAGLQDPGNLGTLMRSAEAFGATGLLLLPGTVNPWSAKTVRASAGSAFRLPVLDCDEPQMLALLGAAGVQLVAAVAAQGATPCPACNLRAPTALLIGNEGAGLSPGLIAIADQAVTIPYPGAAESLNAAVAGSILLYEAARQRAQGPE